MDIIVVIFSFNII